MTPAELNTVIDAYMEEQMDKTRLAIVQAFYTAALGRAKKMPKLDELLKKIEQRKKRKMTAEEMFAVVRQLHAAFGGD